MSSEIARCILSMYVVQVYSVLRRKVQGKQQETHGILTTNNNSTDPGQ